jgi:hypothetical protein
VVLRKFEAVMFRFYAFVVCVMIFAMKSKPVVFLTRNLSQSFETILFCITFS